jgi:hypothetical protein
VFLDFGEITQWLIQHYIFFWSFYNVGHLVGKENYYLRSGGCV